MSEKIPSSAPSQSPQESSPASPEVSQPEIEKILEQPTPLEVALSQPESPEAKEALEAVNAHIDQDLSNIIDNGREITKDDAEPLINLIAAQSALCAKDGNPSTERDSIDAATPFTSIVKNSPNPRDVMILSFQELNNRYKAKELSPRQLVAQRAFTVSVLNNIYGERFNAYGESDLYKADMAGMANISEIKKQTPEGVVEAETQKAHDKLSNSKGAKERTRRGLFSRMRRNNGSEGLGTDQTYPASFDAITERMMIESTRLTEARGKISSAKESKSILSGFKRERNAAKAIRSMNELSMLTYQLNKDFINQKAKLEKKLVATLKTNDYISSGQRTDEQIDLMNQIEALTEARNNVMKLRDQFAENETKINGSVSAEANLLSSIMGNDGMQNERLRRKKLAEHAQIKQKYDDPRYIQSVAAEQGIEESEVRSKLREQMNQIQEDIDTIDAKLLPKPEKVADEEKSDKKDGKDRQKDKKPKDDKDSNDTDKSTTDAGSNQDTVTKDTDDTATDTADPTKQASGQGNDK